MRSVVLLIFLFVGIPQANEQTPACAAAVAKVDYMGLQTVSEETNALVESYRQDWRIFCGDGKERPSLADLYKKGLEVNRKLNDAPYAKETELLYQLIPRNYPKFLPGFVGGPANGFGDVFFDLSTEQFRQNAYRGTEQDQLYFTSRINSFKEADNPYQEGGCVKYGEFDWLESLKELVELKKQLKTDIYLSKVEPYEDWLLQADWSPDLIQSCRGNKEAVLKDLKTIRDFVKSEPSLGEHASETQHRVELVESGKIKIEVGEEF